MPIIYLLRHAKSSWSHPALEDFERPLNDRGLREAVNLGERLGRRKPAIRRILSSPAIRAYQTAVLVGHRLGLGPDEIDLEPRLYKTEEGTEIADLARSFAAEWDRVLVIGHNPGIAEAVNALSGKTVELKTASMARLETDDSGSYAFAEEINGR